MSKFTVQNQPTFQNNNNNPAQSSLFKKSDGIPQRFLSRIKPEFCIESGNNGSPQSFMSDGTLSKSHKDNDHSPESEGNGNDSLRFNSGNMPQAQANSYGYPSNNPPPQNHQDPSYANMPQLPYNGQQTGAVSQNLYRNHFNKPIPNPNHYHQQNSSNQWNNYQNPNPMTNSTNGMNFQQPYPPNHPMSAHSFDSHGSGSRKQKYPKSAYAPPVGMRNFNRLQVPPQGRGYYKQRNFRPHQPYCNYNSPGSHPSNTKTRKSLCNCGTKRDTLAAKLILNSMTAGNVMNNNEKNLVNNFVRHFRFFGKNLEEARKKHYKNIFDITTSSLKRVKLCPNLPKELGEDQIDSLKKAKYEEMSPEKLLELCEEGKDSSNKLQNYLNFSEKEKVVKIYEKMKKFVYDLCFNKYANYIVQLFIEKIDEIKQEFTTMFIKNFDEMISNQYASRVLQKMIILQNDEFINYAIGKLESNYKFFLKDLSSMIFTTKLITEAKRPSKFGFFEKIIKANPSIIIKEPNLIRILVSVFTVCDIDMLSKLFEEFIPYLWNIINHKFGMYIIQKVVERNIAPHKELIVKTCLESIEEMIEKRYSKYVLFKVIEFDKERKFTRRFLAAVLKDEDLLFKRILKMNDSTCLFLLSILNLSRRELKYLFPKINVILMKDCKNFESRKQCKDI